MVTNYKDIIEFLKKDALKDQDLKPEQFKEAVKKIANSLHDKINLAKERLVDYGIKAFEKEDKLVSSSFSLPDEEANKGKNIKLKVHELVASLDGMLKRTEYLDDAIKQIKDEPFDKLLVTRKGVIDFKMTRKFELKVNGKLNADLKWKSPQNKPTYSAIDTSDDSILKIMGNCCYNYYQTDKEFSTEDVEVELVTNGYQVSNYFYFGIRNETTDPNNNCMCCTPSSVTYFRSSGLVCYQGSSVTETKLSFTNTGRQEVRIRMRLMCSEKKVYFEVNGQGECGPYTISGSKFTFTSGSCNECSGFIRIDSAQII